VFPRRCFLSENVILAHTEWGTPMAAILVHLETGKIEKLIPKGVERASTTVLDIFEKKFVLLSSNPSTPHTVIFGTFGEGNLGFTNENIKWLTIHSPPPQELLENVAWQIKQVKPSSEPRDQTFDVIHAYPAKTESSKKHPLVVYPHGGPHSSFTAEYSTSVPFLVSLGYSVVMVNYRGSLGFGSDFVNVLPGRCGELDINDCLDAVSFILNEGNVDPENIVVVGGSHGGFVAGHLIARSHPTIKFKACVMRNPVTDIAAMVGTTDIPDWCFVESGAPLVTLVPKLDDLEKMYQCSPIAKIDNIKTPTLFMIGQMDKRVPPAQGMSMYYALKERNISTGLFAYPKDGHPLASGEAEPDQWVNIALWINSYVAQY